MANDCGCGSSCTSLCGSSCSGTSSTSSKKKSPYMTNWTSTKTVGGSNVVVKEKINTNKR